MFVYYQFGFLIKQLEETLRETRKLEQTTFSSRGPAGIFAFYLPQSVLE
jgi:hypothetical protein